MSNLSEKVYNAVKQHILQWEYPPGYHLTEDALCEEFEVSRIRSASRTGMLEENTFVEKIPHQGCRVRQCERTSNLAIPTSSWRCTRLWPKAFTGRRVGF